jgi:UDP-2,3-diacylglucosamine pyrophosphatase LpxH
MASEKIFNFTPVAKAFGLKRLLVFSDVHLLHRRVPTWHMVTYLREMIEACGNTVDAIYIAGDLFDDSRYLRQSDSQESVGFVTWLLYWCKQTNTALRIIEGTPSHDHGQSKIVETLNLAIGAECLYLDKIGVFYDEVIGATVGWVQDEYKAAGADGISAVATEQEMAELLATRCLEKVDFFFMHGCFKFQLPMIDSPRSFDESFWLSKTKHGIYIGHDHRRKVLDKITVTGSTDRLTVAEEEPKGMTIVDFNDTVCRNWFYENPFACPQRKVRHHDDYDAHYEACLNALRFIDEHPASQIGWLEIEYHAGSPIAGHISRWKKEYSFHIEGSKVATPEEKELLTQAFSNETVAVETITPDNTERIMLEELASVKYNPSIVSDIIRKVL